MWKLVAVICAALLAGTAVSGFAGETVTSPNIQSGGASEAPLRTSGRPVTDPIPLKIKLPFPQGTSYKVIQGNHGNYTHSGFNKYAWDFAMAENSEVCAAASGRVVRVKQDGTEGGPSSRYFEEGNTIIIDHGGGYYSQYLHLAPKSVRVREGDLVAGGQVIALSGNTGFSSTPHLHFHIQGPSGQSLPVRFEDIPGDGIPREGTMVTSGNDGSGVTQYTGESFLPPDIFQDNSIYLISRSLPGHLFRAGREYQVRGRLTASTANRVAIYFMGSSGGQALYTVYAKVDPNGFFDAHFNLGHLKDMKNWDQDTSQSNLFSMAIAPVNGDGSFWSDISVPVCVR